MATKKHTKTHIRFECINCDFKCYAKSDWERHILRPKHLENVKINNLSTKNTKKHKKTHSLSEYPSDNENAYECFCGKEFKERSGLWRHKKKCEILHLQNIQDANKESDKNINTSSNIVDINNLTALICELVKSNTDIHKSVIELCKNGTNNNNVNTNTNIINSHNKTFNLQVFLNETCKDAMNISDFIESVQLQVSDLENVGKVGYIEGISNIIIKNLNALEVNKRPVHCADQKREVMYVKEDNVWEKEDEANKRLRKAIRKIAHKNICMFKAFREKYPDCEEYDSKKNSQYNIIIYESMGGKGDNDYEKDTKIIKKIAKVVGIDKS
jgi:hypothetical protein